MTASCSCKPSSALNKIFLLGINLWPALVSAQGLELGPEDATKVISDATQFPFANLVLILFSVYLILGILFFIFAFLKRKPDWKPPVFLERFPVSAKMAISLALASFGLVHLLSLLEVYLVTRVSFKSSSEYFFYMKLPKLAATSHAHFFGHATMYLITSLIFIFSKLSEIWKLLFMGLALSAGLIDVPAWWAIKYGGGGYEVVSAIAGTMSVLGWGFMASRTLFEMWWIELKGRRI